MSLVDFGVCSYQKYSWCQFQMWRSRLPDQHSTADTAELWLLCALCHCKYSTGKGPTTPLHHRLQQTSWWFGSGQDLSHKLIYSTGSLFPADSPSWSSGFPAPLWSKFSLTGQPRDAAFYDVMRLQERHVKGLWWEQLLLGSITFHILVIKNLVLSGVNEILNCCFLCLLFYFSFFLPRERKITWESSSSQMYLKLSVVEKRRLA